MAKELIPHVQCKAFSRTSGGQCKRYAIHGGTVCRYHGGASPNAIRKAQERLAAAKAERVLAQVIKDAAPVEDPLQALMDLATEAWAAKEYFRSKIEALRYESHAGEQLRSEVALYERALDRCMKILGEVARLGIAERRAKIQEAQAVLIVRAFERVLAALELDDRQRVIATQVVPQELRALETAEGGVLQPPPRQRD